MRWGTVLGDFNGDGAVDSSDYSAWADHYGQDRGSVFAPGSYANPGAASIADYTTWADHFGRGALAVPEPGCAALLLAGALALKERRR